MGARHLRFFQLAGHASVTACDANASLLAAIEEEYNTATGDDWERDSRGTSHDPAVADRDSHFVAQASALLADIDGKRARRCSVGAAAQTLRFILEALACTASGMRVSCQHVHA